ncbi:DUF732 domain-containing protein [Streptomyces yangpuensis]|uniref:DUF732 domain-containing protein n=1 Tax=Streptomyces yangpuensis TaxID=1648182 RepID=UPI003714D314
MTIGVLALSPSNVLAGPPANYDSTTETSVSGAYGLLSPSSSRTDEFGLPGALPGIFRCDSQKTETDGDLYYNQNFINEFRNRFPYTTFDNNQIANAGHIICKALELNAESAVVQQLQNLGWGWNDATWVVGTSENYFCPSARGGDVVIPGAEPS